MVTKSSPLLKDVEAEKLLTELKKQLDLLKVEYEKYINQTKKTPPFELEKTVAALIRSLDHVTFGRTEHQFKFNTLRQHYNSFLRYLSKITGEVAAKPLRDTPYTGGVDDSQTTDSHDPSYVNLYSKYRTEKTGDRVASLDAFKRDLNKKLTELKMQVGDPNARFDVSVTDGKIKITQVKKANP